MLQLVFWGREQASTKGKDMGFGKRRRENKAVGVWEKLTEPTWVLHMGSSNIYEGRAWSIHTETSSDVQPCRGPFAPARASGKRGLLPPRVSLQPQKRPETSQEID